MQGYDVIIAGAGSAGCVMAARLSENPDCSVLLLEAGPDYPEASALPAEIRSAYRPAFSHDWDYASQPDVFGHTVHLPRARIVGGCSATNATFALRGAPTDYDEWAALGNPGWTFADALPFFRRLENDADFDDDRHGHDGPLAIRRYSRNELTPVQQAFLEACVNAGYPSVADHNAPGAIGIGRTPTNALDGVRQSTALTYLAQARRRPNLTLRSGVLVDRVLFEGRRAVGIRLANPIETVAADRIILAAGTYGSPAILLRSGLGPADHLQELGIAVVENLAGVGENFIDHPLLGLRFATPAPAQPAAIPGFQTVLTWKSSSAADGRDLHLFPLSAIPVEPSDSPSGACFMIFVSVMKPHSRGRLRLRSSDPTAAPLIDLGYFTHPDDLPRMIEAVRIARRLARTAPLSELNLQELYPGEAVPNSEDALATAVRAEVETYHHPVGTCRMGPATDACAVTDSLANVHSVERLSVVDASIMPTIPAANTNLPTIMIAERCAADWIESGRVPSIRLEEVIH